MSYEADRISDVALQLGMRAELLDHWRAEMQQVESKGWIYGRVLERDNVHISYPHIGTAHADRPIGQTPFGLPGSEIQRNSDTSLTRCCNWLWQSLTSKRRA